VLQGQLGATFEPVEAGGFRFMILPAQLLLVDAWVGAIVIAKESTAALCAACGTSGMQGRSLHLLTPIFAAAAVVCCCCWPDASAATVSCVAVAV
jgi:hypothetical protein